MVYPAAFLVLVRLPDIAALVIPHARGIIIPGGVSALYNVPDGAGAVSQGGKGADSTRPWLNQAQGWLSAATSSSMGLMQPVVTVTAVKTVTTTVTERPETTNVIRYDPLSTVTSTTTLMVPSSTISASSTIWRAPATMTDLSAFKVSKFAGGQQNLKVVSTAPTSTLSSLLSSSATGHSSYGSESYMSPDNDPAAALELLYPAQSINPANKDAPRGGAEFYATPLDLHDATKVALSYRVFFPADFDFVRGGKLPGLYGGHPSCSGGNAALDCFSTRLMWRAEGKGELYLYAPKFKQTKALCNDSQSVCDTDYGLSIGRGSFTFRRGVWTTVTQTVALNTPGQQDGKFTLVVDGDRVIHREDVFYRENLRPISGTKSSTTHTANTGTTHRTKLLPTIAPPDIDFPHEPLLGGLFGREYQLMVGGGQAPVSLLRSLTQTTQTTTTTTTSTVSRSSSLIEAMATNTVTVASPSLGSPTVVTEAQSKTKLVEFAGIFFSTFFGGHDQRFATPRDQRVWFKDFTLINNGREPQYNSLA